MSGNLEFLMWLVGAMGILLAIIMIGMEIRDWRRGDCRACHGKLDRPGGYYAKTCGSGFCESCARGLNRYVRKS